MYVIFDYDLHSTIFILKLYKHRYKVSLKVFTFYYIYIKTALFINTFLDGAKFTFYYIYIKTVSSVITIYICVNLHSTIFILKQEELAIVTIGVD